MKKHLLLILFFSLFYNCKISKKPTFVGVEKIKIINATKKNITLSANALFKNPNSIGGTLKTDGLKVLINNNEVANFVTETFKVPKKKEFTIPLTVSVSTDSILGQNKLGGLLGSLLSQNLNVQYKGKIDYKILGVSSSYDVDKTEKVKLKF